MGRTPNCDRSDSMGSNNAFYEAFIASRGRQPAGNGDGGSREDLSEFSRMIRGGGVASPVPLDTATKGAVCAGGHAQEGAVLEGEEFVGPCPKCGADVITECPRCGSHFDMGEHRAIVRPRCPHCGEAFPWSAEARRARWMTALKVLGAAAAGVTIMVGALGLAEFFR